MKSREGSRVKHCVRFTLLAQLLLILVGFWVGICFCNANDDSKQSGSCFTLGLSEFQHDQFGVRSMTIAQEN